MSNQVHTRILKETTSKETCFECGSYVVQTFADVVCSQCGLVQRRNYVEPHFAILEQDDWRPNTYVAQSNRPNIVDDLGSFLGHYRSSRLRDPNGNLVSNQRNMQRQKKINDLDVHTQGKKRQYRALRMLNALMGVLELSSSTRDDAAILFQKTEAKLEGEVYIAEMIAGAVYLSVRTNSTENLQLKDLMQACENAGLHVRQNKVLRAAAMIKKISKRQVGVPQPSDYFEEIFNKITQDKGVLKKLKKKQIDIEDYTRQIRALAKELMKRVQNKPRGGRKPYVTATAVYIGANTLFVRLKLGKKNLFVSQISAAKICDVAEFTLREHWLKIVKPICKSLCEEKGWVWEISESSKSEGSQDRRNTGTRKRGIKSKKERKLGGSAK